MFKARDVMTRNTLTVRPDTPVYEAMRVLVANSITGLPVIGDNRELLGIVSEKDMLRILYEESLGKAPVEQVMTRDVVSFSEDDDLIDICECLIANNFRRVPVLMDGQLVGIISRRDIIKYILKIRKEA